MKKQKELSGWDFPDTIRAPNGYDMESVPDLTRDSFQYLIEEHNNLVEAFNAMADFNGFADFVSYED